MTASHPVVIGLVGPLPPPSGGMANQTRQLGNLLRDAGMMVELVQVNAPYRPGWIEHLRGVRAVWRLVPYLFRLWHCAGRVDLIHVMGNSGWAWHLFAAPAVWIGRLRGIPVIVNYRGGEAEAFLKRQSAWVKPTLRQAAAIVVPSGFLEEIFARFDIVTEVVPNIIDLSRFHPPSLVPAGHHVAVTRNLEDIYDIPTALRAFAEIRRTYPDATLTVAGSGPKLGELQDLARVLGVVSATCFTGRLDNDKMADLYRQTNLVLNSSTVDNMPVSLLEAMASGVPIVTTSVGGIPHLVKDGKSALLVPPRHPEAMAAAALRIFADDAFAVSMRSAAIDAVSSYTWMQVRPRLFRVYSRALGGASLNQPAT